MTTATLNPSRTSAQFVGAWIVASVVGMIVAAYIGIFVGYGGAELIEPVAGELAAQIVVGLGFGLGLGAGLGLPHWLVLRTRLPGSVGYVWGSLLGALVSWAIVFPLAANRGGSSPNLVTILAFAAVVGLAMGAGQWLALRGKLPRACVLVSGVSVTAAVAVLFGLSGEGREIVATVSAGLVHGVLSGAGLLWVLRST
jgi:hypothetical protein